jgi:hypothetical protein
VCVSAGCSLAWHVFLVMYHAYCYVRHPLSRASGDGSGGGSRTYSLWRSIALASWLPPTQPNIQGLLPLDVTDAERALEKLRSRLARRATVRKSPRTAGAAAAAAAAAEPAEVVPVRPTWTHLFAHCISLALRDNPRANARAHLGRVIPGTDGVDLFMQVALKGDSLSGVLVRGADRLSVADLARESQRRVGELRGGRDENFQSTLANLRFIPSFVLRPILLLTSFLGNDLGLSIPALGVPRDPFGTVQVTSLGMFDCVDAAFAPFFPLGRASLVLLVAGVKDKPAVVAGKVVPRRMVNICVTFDHRVVDGVLGAKVGDSFRQHLDNWVREELAISE